LKDKLFFFTDIQQTRQVAGSSTGVLQVMSDDERNGIFPDSALTGAVQGAAWAQTLTNRNPTGGTVGAGTPYNQLGTAVITGGVPGHDLSAYIDPISAATLNFIPQSNLAGGQYSDSSHSGQLIDTNMSQRIDFINHMTGGW
jgi:hypothetical protein